jgi:exosome complex RNA-binding protein Rrp4
MEDSLDCPLAELQFIVPAGDRIIGEGSRREPVYEFRGDINADVSSGLFVYCLFDFWNRNRNNESTISFQDIAIVNGSVGQIFKLSEMDLRSRLETLQKDSGGAFEYISSAAVPRVLRHVDLNEQNEDMLLNAIYERQPIKPKKTKIGKRVHAH